MDIKVLSSLAKVFPDEICCGYEQNIISCLKNERTSFQIAVKSDKDCEISINVTKNSEFITIYSEKTVPVGYVADENRDEYFIRNASSGDYPDVLVPLDGSISAKKNKWTPIWFDFSPGGKLDAGTHDIEIAVNDEKIKLTAEISSASFGEQSLVCTHWFHSDCLATYYGVEVFSEEYWRITENFVKEAVRNGINLLLTPIFTPPLDTEVGGERPTVQLVNVTKHGYTYTFNFEKLQRWIDMANRCGVKYIEISHLFTQWGAKHAPKIMANTSSGYKQIFGWDTNALGQGYEHFLRQLAPELINFINENNLRDRVMFHTSDEPSIEDYYKYKKAAKLMKELFGDFKIIDALSEFSFYKNGVIANPVTNIGKIDNFAGKVPELWTYYCCSPSNHYNPNRFLTMPSLRNRILGLIMYKYDVKGFLHWGYNFYFTQYSKRPVDPYTETDAGGNFPSGDSFVVYPAKDGTAYDSLRLKVFHDAINDFEALRLLEKKMSRKKIIEMLDSDAGKPITSSDYPHDEKWLLDERRKINSLLNK